MPNATGDAHIRSLRALHLISNLARGGGQEVVRTLVRALPAAGVQPVVATFEDGPLRAEIEAEGIEVALLTGRRLPASAGLSAVRDLRRVLSEVGDVARRHRIDVLQTHLLRSLDWPMLLLRGNAGVPAVIWTVHNAMLDLRQDQVPGGAWTVAPKRFAHRAAYTLGGRMVDAIVAVSDDVARAIRASYHPPAARLATIPNGVDVDRYGGAVDRAGIRQRLGVPSDGPLIVVVAKLMAQKGHGDLLDALPAVLQANPSTHVALLGEGELESSLRTRVATEGLGAAVTFLGSRSDIPDVLAAADLFVLPSLWEGLPMALLEAMASGLPVVATEVSGTREVVEDGRSGVLVPPRSPERLAAGIVRVLRDGALAASLGTAARSRVEDRYSSLTQARRHAELYRRVIDRRHTR